MNLPGRPSGNWGWRFAEGQISDDVQHRLREMTELYGRQPE
jgi:4-alpha-glucanotransferase